MFYKLIGECIGGIIPYRKYRRMVKNYFYQLDCKKNAKRYKKKFALVKEKIKTEAKKRKIKIGFFVSEKQKWNCQSLYDELVKSNYFEPFILIAPYFKKRRSIEEIKKNFDETYEFFYSKNFNFHLAYDKEKKKYIDLKNFNPDIIFYQQPWGISKKQHIEKTSDYVLACYVPYCFYMLDCELNYLHDFHQYLWKYFVESPVYEEQYHEKFNAENCIATGHTKLDNYFITTEKLPKDKKIIIYAPHHSFDDIHLFSTFAWNGKFILELARKHPEFNWIFKPHPIFREKLLECNILSEIEIDDYFNAWKEVGQIFNGGDYYDIFKSSCCLITDCISFLAEYLPSENPVLFLRSDKQAHSFSILGEKITEHYYHIHNIHELEALFNKVVINNDDFLKEQRTQDIKHLGISGEKSAAQKIVQNIINELELE